MSILNLRDLVTTVAEKTMFSEMEIKKNIKIYLHCILKLIHLFT